MWGVGRLLSPPGSGQLKQGKGGGVLLRAACTPVCLRDTYTMGLL